MKKDLRYMRMAIALAKKSQGRTSPNPLVGAVVVKGKRVVGRGYHKKAGSAHAEPVALQTAKGNARGATLYVTLEPCDHYGRTPPCTDAIIKSKIKKVVIAMLDPNPLNSGKGAYRLQQAGIQTEVGLLRKEAQAINRPYIKYITKGMPFVTIKIAQTLDGKIATGTGDSHWITNRQSRRSVHLLRSRVDAVIVGVNTVIQDDPLLTSRRADGKAGKQPARIILDSHLRIPIRSKLLSSSGQSPVIIATTKRQKTDRLRALREKGAEILFVSKKKGRVDGKALLKKLAQRSMQHILVEGGGEVAASLLNERLADHIRIFIAPKIAGGATAPTSVGGKGIQKMCDALRIANMRVKRSGDDIVIDGDL